MQGGKAVKGAGEARRPARKYRMALRPSGNGARAKSEEENGAPGLDGQVPGFFLLLEVLWRIAAAGVIRDSSRPREDYGKDLFGDRRCTEWKKLLCTGDG